MAYNSVSRGSGLLNDVMVGENSWNDDFAKVKEKRENFLKKLKEYKMEKEKLEKTLLERKVMMKEMSRILVDLERFVNRLEMKKDLLLKTNKQLPSCS